jgi:hypothetical protein
MPEHVITEQFIAAPLCTAAEAPQLAPKTPGYYAIFVDDATSLKNPFQDLLVQKATNLIYVGIAETSLYQRLIRQDLQHRSPSTFFRAIGSILGYRPMPGSLIGMSNQNNYKFGQEDTTEIIAWIDEHLSVNWLEANPAVRSVETSLIKAYSPIINTDDNPNPASELANLRSECRIIARNPPYGAGE